MMQFFATARYGFSTFLVYVVSRHEKLSDTMGICIYIYISMVKVTYIMLIFGHIQALLMACFFGRDVQEILRPSRS